ncbi:MAG: hypothetical protein AB1505_28965, partial [Candidatus Latescibacterota bacterium]
MAPDTRLLEPVPAAVGERIRHLLPADEEELIRVSADMVEGERYGTQWLVVTPSRVAVLPAAGPDGAQ